MDSIELHSGDWVMSRPVPGKETNLFQKAILLIADHTHDELVCVDDEGKQWVGSAEVPCFRLTPVQEHFDSWRKGERVFGVFRWREWTEGRVEWNGLWQVYQDHVQACVQLLASMKIPYDLSAISSQARNYFRKILHLGWLGTIGRHTEYEVYCTESCWKVSRASGIDCDKRLGKVQPLPAPCHSEQLYRKGELICVEDFGLLQYFKKP